MRFTDPLWLLLLIPAIAGLVWSYRHVHGMAKARKRVAFGLRFLMVACLVVALAGPQSYRPHEGLATVFVLDRSDSVGDAEKARAEAFVGAALEKLGPNDVASIVAFGKDAVIDAAASGRRTMAPIRSEVGAGASDLSSALRLASATFPDGKARRIVLLSDGNETLGDAEGAALALAADGIGVDFFPLGTGDNRREASVAALEAPAETRADEPFELRVLIDSNAEGPATLTLDRDGVPVQSRRVNLSQGRQAIVLSDKLGGAGFFRYRATLQPERDRDPRNNVGAAFVAVRGKPRVLVLQDDPGRSELADALRKGGLEAEVRGPGGVPSRPEGWQAYDAVFLNDFNAVGMTESQQVALRNAVRDSGLGMAMVGGESSFLPGGWYGSPVAEALPVDLDVRQRKSIAAASILIIIDCSGSMSAMEDGQQKLRLAAKAAEETVKLLSPLDRVGVAGSTDGIEFVAPMQSARDKAAVIRQIQRIAITGGGIYIGPSIQAAEKVIRAEQSKVRHLIVMADGDDSTDWRDALARTAAMRADKITTSVVAIGRGKDVPMLRRLAAAGGGRFYLTDKASKLAALVTQDAAVMSRSAIEEGAFIPKVSAGEPIVRGVLDGGFPPLLAYCLTDTRPLSRVGMRTQKDDPLLATWTFGLGTSLAFTSDAQSRWASNWVGWEGFGTFWSQAAREVLRRATRNQYQVLVRNETGRAVVEVQGFDAAGNPLASVDAQVRVASPSGGTADVALTQQAPGVFQGTFDATELGAYLVTVAESDGRGGSRVSSTGFAVPYPPEYRTFRPNRPLLARIADATGGREIAEPQQALRPVANPGASIADLWLWFVLAAALLLPLDIGVRRVAVPVGEMWAKLVGWLRRRRSEPAGGATQQVVLDRLARARTRPTDGGAGEQVGPGPASPVGPVAPSTTRAEAPRPAARPSVGSSSSALLEARRKRKADADD